MKPWISPDELVAEMSKEEAAYAVRARLWADYLEPPPHGIELDQRRIGDRFLELLAEQPKPWRIRVSRPRSGSGPGYAFVVDETHAEFFRRWHAVLDAYTWHGARQSGKTEVLTRFLDEAERLTGIRPTHVRQEANGDVSIAADGADVDEPETWTRVGNLLDLIPPQRLRGELPEPWREVGYTAGGGQVAIAPVGTPMPPAPVGEYREAMDAAVKQLVDEVGIPRHLVL